MVELSLKERLQPALFDRLIDQERHVAVVHITARRAQLQELGIVAEQLLALLCAQGLRHDATGSGAAEGESITWRLLGPPAVSPARLKTLVLEPPGAPLGIELQTFCTIESHTSLNSQVDPEAKRMISMRRLRECVRRDLSWLLNTTHLAALQDLAPYPQVLESVVNYGMPSLAGHMSSSVDPELTARRIQETIAIYEPRLSRIQVTPEPPRDSDEMTLSFRIDAELWGQPVSQHVVLRTSIDLDTGAARVTDAT